MPTMRVKKDVTAEWPKGSGVVHGAGFVLEMTEAEAAAAAASGQFEKAPPASAGAGAKAKKTAAADGKKPAA